MIRVKKLLFLPAITVIKDSIVYNNLGVMAYLSWNIFQSVLLSAFFGLIGGGD